MPNASGKEEVTDRGVIDVDNAGAGKAQRGMERGK